MKFLVMLLLVPCFSYAGVMNCSTFMTSQLVNGKPDTDNMQWGSTKTTVFSSKKSANFIVNGKTFTGFNWHEKSQLYKNDVGAYMLIQEEKHSFSVRLNNTMWLFTNCEKEND